MSSRLNYTDEQINNLRGAFGEQGLAKPIFTVYRSVKREGKVSKKPDHPVGTPGVTFEETLRSYNADRSITGLGVKLGPIPGSTYVLFGIDYDGADKGALPQPWPKSETYEERSPSGGDKFHVLGIYQGKPLEGKRQGAVEIYSEGRFFTLTGERINGATILPTDPLPFYAAIGVPDPQPYSTDAAVPVSGAPVKESDLTERERKFADRVRGIADDDESKRDFAVCCELVSLGASDEEIARVLCAVFPRPKLWKHKKYVGLTIAEARKAGGPSEAEAAEAQAAAVERLRAKTEAFRKESIAIGEGTDDADHYPDVVDVNQLLTEAVFITDGSQVALRADPRIAYAWPDFVKKTAASVVRASRSIPAPSKPEARARPPRVGESRGRRTRFTIFCETTAIKD